MRPPKIPYPDWVIPPMSRIPDLRDEAAIQRDVVYNLRARGFHVIEGQKGGMGKTKDGETVRAVMFMKGGELLDLTIFGPFPQMWVIEMKAAKRYGEPMSKLFRKGQPETIEALRERGWQCWTCFDLVGVEHVMGLDSKVKV